MAWSFSAPRKCLAVVCRAALWLILTQPAPQRTIVVVPQRRKSERKSRKVSPVHTTTGSNYVLYEPTTEEEASGALVSTHPMDCRMVLMTYFLMPSSRPPRRPYCMPPSKN